MTSGVMATHSPNVLRIALHPDGMAPRIANLDVWRAHLLSRVEHTADAALTALYEELLGYPGGSGGSGGSGPGGAGPGAAYQADSVAVPLRYRHRCGDLTFVSTVLTFGAPLDVTVAELAVESFFPADEQTAAALRVHK
jgi:transcription regulator MmyB-like protein